MYKKEIENSLREYEYKLLEIKKMYIFAIERFSIDGTNVTSKLMKDNGLHLINLSEEMESIELKIKMLKKILESKSYLNINSNIKEKLLC